jgi:ElaA protein
MTTIHNESFADLAPDVLYALLKLRVDVFVVEQACAYPELDGRDTEPGTRHLWVTETGGSSPREATAGARPAEPLAYLRLLAEPDGTMRIGRVVTAPKARGEGHAKRLMAAALEADPAAATVLDAQSHLVGWYSKFGFEPSGAEFLEDGIPHTPMRRAALAPPTRAKA